MTRTELVKSLAKEFELSNVKSGKIISYILESITDSLIENQPVAFVGFGTFSVRSKAARKGRNPRSGETIQIAKRTIVRFKVGKKLKESVNKK